MSPAHHYAAAWQHNGGLHSLLRGGNNDSVPKHGLRARTCGAVRRAMVVLQAASTQKESAAIIVGGGMAGLSCAAHLAAAGVPFTLLEASDGLGGRVRTDHLDGFLLDRGFQIFLTSYPEARAALDYPALRLAPFYAGALVHLGAGRFERVADPFRHPWHGLASLGNSVGSPVDKVRVGLARLKALAASPDALLAEPETTILEHLRAEGFSESIIDKFFRPFLGGIFFDRQLGTSSRLFRFVMRMLATGANSLPAGGIGAVADQLAARLPPSSVQTGARVVQISPATNGRPASVALSKGNARITLSAPAGVVVATDGPAAAQLLGGSLATSPSKAALGVGTCNLYFSAPRAPREENILYLNGQDSGIVNNLCFPSTVCASYAPEGKALVSISTIGTLDELTDEQLEQQVRQEVAAWFGSAHVATWQLLRVYRIPFAQPNQAPPTDLRRPVRLGGGLYVAGDHRDSATLDGALKSGRRAAKALVADAGL